MEKLLELGWGASQGIHQDGANCVSQVNGELIFVAYQLAGWWHCSTKEQWHLTELLSQERAS